jgi:hypothetical protein
LSLHINLFEYKNKPFATGLQAYLYSPNKNIVEQDRRFLLGLAAKMLESKIGRGSVVAQYRDNIYCVPFDIAQLPAEILVRFNNCEFVWFRSVAPVRLTPAEEIDCEVIRRLVAHAVAKKQIEQGWFVEPYGFAYHWSYNLSKQLYTEIMDVYPGFVFRPYVYEDGSCAIMIDPKFKFVSKKTFRDLINGLPPEVDEESINLKFQGDFIIDTCPAMDCPHKKDPSSICRLKGSGKRKRLLQLDFGKRPSEAAIGNLVEYHKKPSVCPFHGRIAELIQDVPPIALVEKSGSTGFLEYPVERLRQELEIDRLAPEQRILVMKYIQPPLNERWTLTENFAAFVDEISIGRLCELKLRRAFAKAGTIGKPWERYSLFQEIPLAFGNKASSYDPFLGLERNGPYDLSGPNMRKFNSFRIAICNYSSKVDIDGIKRFYNDLVEGFFRGSKFAGIKRIFRLQIPSFSEEIVYHDLREIEDIARANYADTVIVIAPQFGLKVPQYQPFKFVLTQLGLPSQFVLENKLKLVSNPSRYVSYLKNLVISMYYKIGGVPWVLSRPVNPNCCYVGLATIWRSDTVCMSTQVFDSFGLWLGGWTEIVDVNEYTKRLIERIKKARDTYTYTKGVTPSKTIIHKAGELLADKEAQPLFAFFERGLTCVSVKKTALPRLFDPTTRTDYVVKRGSCVQITDDMALLATTGPPHPIHGSQRPIIVEHKGSKYDQFDLIKICEEVFSLSLVHGYSLAVTSNPITTHFAEKAVQLTAKFNILESPKLWRKAWFL